MRGSQVSQIWSHTYVFMQRINYGEHTKCLMEFESILHAVTCKVSFPKSDGPLSKVNIHIDYGHMMSMNT